MTDELHENTVVETPCANCSTLVPEDEIQLCEVCGYDGLGNCCIGDLDHDCAAPTSGEQQA